eukprot:3081801-Amphidinium_carterae.2
MNCPQERFHVQHTHWALQQNKLQGARFARHHVPVLVNLKDMSLSHAIYCCPLTKEDLQFGGTGQLLKCPATLVVSVLSHSV